MTAYDQVNQRPRGCKVGIGVPDRERAQKPAFYPTNSPFDSRAVLAILPVPLWLSPMAKLTVNDLDVRGKRVFVRVDYNVPMAEQDGQMVINDDTRIRATKSTLDLLIQGGARIILAAHLGRPKGKVEPSMSLKPVAAKLADMVGRPVAFVDDCIGEKVEKTAGALQDGDLMLLENTRFYAEEENNDPDFAGKLAKVADLYVTTPLGPRIAPTHRPRVWPGWCPPVGASVPPGS